MRTIPVFYIAMILSVMAACTAGKQLETMTAGEEAFREGNYTEALALSEQTIRKLESRGRKAQGDMYSLAGISAYKLESYPESLEYLLKAQEQGYSSEKMYLYLARNYLHIDNLSREITALETYIEQYPGGQEIRNVRKRLLQTCLESENFELAGKLWNEMDSASKEDVFNMETYLELNRMRDNKQLCDSLAGRILDKRPDSEPALRWLGESHFWRAENSYQYQMKTYKENRTRKQYAILLEAFKQVSADFRKSRDYFLKLYKLNPDPDYAGYLGNIFMRLEDEEKAAYYKKRAN
jgi:tetratricopeptide (TPR) repeat protein